jgi:tetratricopeptide (TPR) repeat protein/ABC-type iron transport system FetAB ATPase subunit
MKYNPAFLTPAELIDQFVVRQGDLKTVLQTVRENVAGANQHVLVIGPRGSGKTMLVRRLAAEIDRDAELRGRWYPLIFSEESYEVTTPGEFWLEAVFHLGQQTKDPRWQTKYEEYGVQWRDEDAMRERALGQLTAFADEQGKRLLLIVENFNGLLGDQISDDDAWKLRHTLQHEPRVMLLATATSRFEEIDNANKAMYELFRIHDLRPLEQDDCRALWQSLTGQLLEGDRVRPIQILTGGNLRLLTILSTFAAHLSLRELMDDLVGLVDDHTAYFKSHLEALPAVERKVYLALAELWDPSTAREVAVAARMDVNQTSSLLRRLLDRGAVAVLDAPGRTKWYQVAERMYNIYYLFRRRGSPAERVRAVVRFMVSFYEPEELLTAARRIADEACGLEPSQRQDHYQVFCDVVTQSADSLRNKLAEVARERFVGLDDLPELLARIIREPMPAGAAIAPTEKMAALTDGLRHFFKAALSHIRESRFADAEAACLHALQIDPRSPLGWVLLGFVHRNIARFGEAEQAYRKAIKIDPQYAWAWAQLGQLLHKKLSRYDEAEQAYRKAVEIDPQNAWSWAQLGELLHEELSRFNEAEQAYRKAIEIAPQFAWLWVALGQLLHEKLSRFGDAEQAYRKAVEVDPECTGAWALLGELLDEELSRFDEAEKAYRKAIEIQPQYALAWALLGRLLSEKLSRFDEAEQAYRKAVEIDPQYSSAWALLGRLLHEKLSRFNQAEQAYRKAIDMDPQDAWAWAFLGQLLHEKLARFDEAEQAYRKAIDVDPQSAWTWAMLGRLLHEKLSRFDDAGQAYRKAIEIDPQFAFAWTQLGQLLHEKLSRFDEAEQAYRKAVEIDPQFVWAWLRLGQLLHEKLSRFDEAEQAYRKAIAIDPQSAWTWTQLGKLLHEKLSRLDEAEQAYRKAIEIEPQVTWSRVALQRLLLRQQQRREEALQFSEDAISQSPDDPQSLNAFAWVLLKMGEATFLGRALTWARRAVALAPETAVYRHTLASIECALGSPQDALKSAEKYLADPKTVGNTLEDATNLFVQLAARGEARGALQVLLESPSRDQLEPLAVGIRLFLGEDVNVAVEIKEIGSDVARRIQQRRDALRAALLPPQPVETRTVRKSADGKS